MSVALRVRLIAALAAASLVVPAAAALADPGDRLEESRAAEAATASSIADLERQLAQLSAAREEAAIRAGLANEAYLEATVHLDAARAESRQAQRAADAAAAEAEVARGALATIAQLLYQGGSASLASITPFLTDDFASAMRTATHMDQLARRTDAQLQHFEALRTVSAILTERAERARAAEQAAVDSLAAAAETAQEQADAAAFQLAFSTEQRDALIEQLARQRETTVELERARQDALEEQRIERENRAALREAQAVAAIDSLAVAPAVAPAPELVDERDTAVSRDGDRVEDTSSPASTAPTSAPSPTTPSPTTPSPTPTTPSPAPTTPSPAPTTPSPTPSPTPTTPSPAPTTPSPTPTTPAPAPTTPAPAPTTPAPAPPPPAPAPLPASQIALNFALAQVGKPYVWGADGPDSYDCSGLTTASYLAAGIYIGRTTRTQYAETARVPLADMRPGDLVFYSSDGTAAGIYHVAMYTGNNMRVHAPSPGKLVEHVKMYYYNVMPYAGRVTG